MFVYKGKVEKYYLCCSKYSIFLDLVRRMKWIANIAYKNNFDTVDCTTISYTLIYIYHIRKL